MVSKLINKKGLKMKNKKNAELPEWLKVAAAEYGIELATNVKEHPEEKNNKKFLTINEAVLYTGLSRWTIARQVTAGKIPQIKLGSTKQATVLLDKSDIDRWLCGLKNKSKHPMNAMTKSNGN
jgi:excisionase family DNA binding protein